MSERINTQDAFLNYVRKNKIPVTIFLLNGVKLTGLVSCFDQATIILKREGYIQLVYKHAISTFSPHSSVNIFDSSGGGYAAPYQSADNTVQSNDTETIEEKWDDEGISF